MCNDSYKIISSHDSKYPSKAGTGSVSVLLFIVITEITGSGADLSFVKQTLAFTQSIKQ